MRDELHTDTVVLALNAGSSSLKASLFSGERASLLDAVGHIGKPVWEAHADWSDLTEVPIRFAAKNRIANDTLRSATASAVFERVLDGLHAGDCAAIQNLREIAVVGHRVVHGGERFRASTLITPAVRQAIEDLEEAAPSHNHLALEGIRVLERLSASGVPQVAVFDTAFHADLEPVSFVYPGPYHWLEQGIRRFGFHGISHAYAARRTAELLDVNLQSVRMITCHLGSGCSLAAILEGKSIGTTMGYTPLEGLMMSTRSGTVDPGILLHVLKRNAVSVDELEHSLNRESGLLGISGVSGDMRRVIELMATGHKRARLAFEMYVYQIQFHIGAMLPALGGLDALVFTGGVGENSSEVRAAVCNNLGFIGIEVDRPQNETGTGDRLIGVQRATAKTAVVFAAEEGEIAREAVKTAALHSAQR